MAQAECSDGTVAELFYSRGSFSIFQAHFAYVLGNLSNSILSP